MTTADDTAGAPQPGTVIGPVHHRADEVMLFQFSAVTWNAHRVHYDAPYTTTVEGLPGLLVTGPLQAALLENLLTVWAAPYGGRVRSMEYRHRAQAYAGAELQVRGVVRDVQGDEVTCEVWVEVDGNRTTDGTATVALPG